MIAGMVLNNRTRFLFWEAGGSDIFHGAPPTLSAIFIKSSPVSGAEIQ